MTKSYRVLKSSVAAGALLALGTGALAQQSGSATETVVVTGTRIQRAEFDTPNPVQMVGSQDLANVGATNIANYLVKIPALQSSLGNYDTSGYGTPASNNGSSLAGLNLLDLRGLGYGRTLVLVDGKRHVSQSTGEAAVDTNTIPLSLVDRVEVATGGASAIYGADGVSGVVNFIMKRNLEGLHAKAQGGLSQDGGGNTLLTSLAYGYNTDDGKGNVSAALEFSEEGRLNYMDRSFTRPGGIIRFVKNLDGSTPQRVPTYQHQYIFSGPGGVVFSDAYNLFASQAFPDFNGDGTPYVPGRWLNDFEQIGGSGQPSANVTSGDFLPVQSRKIAQVDGHYDFGDALKVSAEFKYAKVTSDSMSTPPWDDYTVIQADNAFLTPAMSTAITNGEAGYGLFGTDYLGLRRRERVTRDTFRTSLDVTGDISGIAGGFVKDLVYDISYVWGQTEVDDGDMGIRVEDRFFASMDSVKDSNGKAVCRSNLNPGAVPATLLDLFGADIFSDTTPLATSDFGKSFTPGPNSGCIAYDPFHPFSAQSLAAKKFMTTDLHTTGLIQQQVISGTLAGNFPQAEAIFDGPLSVVIGGEYRFEASTSKGDPAWYPGYTFDNQPEATKGSFNVGEAFAEVSLPVLKNKPFAQELTIDGAVRYSSYSTAGTTTTWKFGGVWAPFEWLRLRGTDAYAVRAPNVGELYAPQQTLYSSVNDPCDKNFVNAGTGFRAANCQAIFSALGLPYNPLDPPDLATSGTIKTFISGNTDLKPESARTLTLGFVVQPIPNLTFSADWYRVIITNAITAPDAQQIVDKCVDLSSISNAFCGLITRDPSAANDGKITLISEKQINVASYETAGVDFDLAYHFDPRDFGVESDYGLFDMHLLGNYLNSLNLTPLPGEKPEYQVAESGSPKWQTTFSLTWTYGDLDVTYDWDWASRTLRYSHIIMAAAPDRVAPEYIYAPSKNVSNIQVGYRFGEEYRAYFGVNNLFYQKPGPGYTGYPVEPLGRFFYFGLTIDTKGGLPRMPL
jgi:outer membrane receptor protein involved in Fe transport